MPKLDEYVRIREAAEYLGVHRNTLRNWGRTGIIPERRHPVSNYRLFKQDDLQQVLNDIVDSGKLPTGWPRRRTAKRKPR